MTKTVLLACLDGTTVDDHRQAFRDDGYTTQLAMDHDVARALMASERIIATILFGRQAASAFPLLTALTAQARPQICLMPVDGSDEIALLDAGASLCLPLDTSPADLLAWTRALLAMARRNWPAEFDFDLVGRRATFGGETLPLRPIEFDILLHLARHAGRPVDDGDLQRHLWPERAPSPQRLAVTIHTLRAALAPVGADILLRTIPRAGYALLNEPPPPRRLRAR